jgi:hypothetical protein
VPDSPDPSTDRSAHPAPARPGPDRPGQPRWLWAAVALVVLAVAAGAVFVGTRGDTSGTALQPSADATSPSAGGSPGSPSPTRGTDQPSDDPTAEPSADSAAWERRDQLQTPRDDFRHRGGRGPAVGGRRHDR